MVGWVGGRGCQILLELTKFRQKVVEIGWGLVGFGKISLDLVKISLDLAGFGWILLDHIVILPKFMYMISWVGSLALVIGGKDP